MLQVMKRHKVATALTMPAIVYLVLLVPEGSPPSSLVAASEMTRPFLWNQDARWDSLEVMYVAARNGGSDQTGRRADTLFREADGLLGRIETERLMPGAPEFSHLEQTFFSLAPMVGAQPGYVNRYVAFYSRMRVALKHQSEQWDVNGRQARETLYRLLYGGRTAVEEVILQSPPEQKPPSLLLETDEPSVAPAAKLLGATIRSGDILVSRGAVPTSALIARGNDFPGNFSHVALAHVDSASGELSLIEAHIERGVAVASAEQYLGDAKLRVMVLRLRSDLPATREDPLLPHRAATAMLQRAREGHIPYDFPMDYGDTTEFFCSEVASAAYRPFGVNLWMGMSHISSPGLRSWLGDFGVRHWETQEPSDLEYDPQLRVVAEWRDPEVLRKDHIDNAVTEAMLERAEQGERLTYSWYMLPVARLVKGYSSMLNFFGAVGPIPEGMNATSALKHKYYVDRHDAAAAVVRAGVESFRREQGYEPPYWQLVRIGRTALSWQH